MEQQFVVYAHKKATDGTIFYIGKGMEDRPNNKTGRSRHWWNIVKKHGYEVSILHENLTEEEAFALERHYIAFYGRKDQGKGTLVNLTDGGEGASGRTHTEETRAKLSAAHKGENNYNFGKNLSAEHRARLSASLKGRTFSEESRAKMSEAMKGKKNAFGRMLSAETRAKLSAANKGKTHSAETRAKISEAKKGKTFSAETRAKMSEARSGGKHHQAKPVINLETGICYSCGKEAAQVYGMNYGTLKAMLNGYRRNKTPLAYA